MITGMRFAPHPGIHARVFKVRGEHRVQQEMVNAQAGILLPVLTEIIPERIHALLRVQVPHRVDPALGQESLVALAALRLKKRIL